MSTPDILRRCMAILLLGSGMVASAGAEMKAIPDEQWIPARVAPAARPDMAPAPAMWMQMMPVARPMMYYWAPPPGMMWPMQPQYPVPMAMPPVVWVMVPVPSPALVDYGPVAATPVVELPSMDAAAQATIEDAAPVAVVDYGPVTETPVVELPPMDAAPRTMIEEAVPVADVDYGPVTVTPVVEMPSEPDPAQAVLEDAALAAALAQEVASSPESSPPAVLNSQSPVEAVVESSALAVAVQVDLPPVDYGPVTPTPVVDLQALESQAAKLTVKPAATPKKSVRKKSGISASTKPVANAKPEPAKRMCWTKGVVAPCR